MKEKKKKAMVEETQKKKAFNESDQIEAKIEIGKEGEKNEKERGKQMAAE